MRLFTYEEASNHYSLDEELLKKLVLQKAIITIENYKSVFLSDQAIENFLFSKKGEIFLIGTHEY